MSATTEARHARPVVEVRSARTVTDPRHARPSGACTVPERPLERRRSGGLAWPLAVATTAVISFAALVAGGAFDAMLDSL